MKLARLLVFTLAVLTAASGMAAAQSFVPRPRIPVQTRLSVTSNVAGATVYVDNRQLGTTPFTLSLNPGVYRVTVRADGYYDYTTTVTVNGPTSITAYLRPMNYSLTVTSNVNGANVYLNGRYVGQTPVTASVRPGSYDLRVEAGGYQSYRTRVTVNQSSSINAQLQGMLARIHIRIPDQFLNFNNDSGRSDRRRALNDVRVFVDNRRVYQDNFEVQPGNHTIRFESGSLEVQQSFYFNAGQDYTLSPVLSIQVN